MIIWCFADDNKSIKFCEDLGGKKVETKQVKIGDKYYQEFGLYFDLEEIMANPF